MDLQISQQPKFHPTWWNRISSHFGEQYMQNIYKKLTEYSNARHQIIPKKEHLFSQFRNRFDDTYVIFIVPHPIYHYNKSRVWNYMSLLIESECYNGLMLNLEENMEYLVDQHVIHVPVTFTQSSPDRPSHFQLGWQQLSRDILKQLSDDKSNKKMFIYEEDCIEMLEVIDTSIHEVQLLQPGVFREINKFMKEQYNLSVKW